MQEILDIAYRHMDRIDELDDFIERQLDKYDHVFDHVTRCEVVIEKAQKNTAPGGLYKVRISILTPRRRELVIKKEANINGSPQKLTQLMGLVLKAAMREVSKVKAKESSAPRELRS